MGRFLEWILPFFLYFFDYSALLGKIVKINFDDLVKSPLIVTPDFIRHSEPIELTEFLISPE